MELTRLGVYFIVYVVIAIIVFGFLSINHKHNLFELLGLNTYNDEAWATVALFWPVVVPVYFVIIVPFGALYKLVDYLLSNGKRR